MTPAVKMAVRGKRKLQIGPCTDCMHQLLCHSSMTCMAASTRTRLFTAA